MERLTAKWKPKLYDAFDPIDVADNEYSKINFEKLLTKLGEYEDLEEQCIEENQCGLRELLLKWKEFFDDIAELYEYRKAEEQGLLLRLPCKVGDTVYVIPSQVNYDLNVLNRHTENNRVYAQIVDSMRMWRNGKYCLSTCEGLRLVLSEYFGETWFLTKGEAENALAGLAKTSVFAEKGE